MVFSIWPSCDNLSSFSADNPDVNFGKKKSVHQHLLSDSDFLLKLIVLLVLFITVANTLVNFWALTLKQ